MPVTATVTGICIKRSSQAGYKPLAAELQAGELALNTADNAIYAKNSQGVVVRLNPEPPALPESVTALSVAGIAYSQALLLGR